jgi:DNA-binding CsgD family transcriptional regulator/tetratricopeptide (TPR) repeat protein
MLLTTTTTDTILERGPTLVEMSHLLHEAAAGDGRLLFVGGEAGIGKSVLVRRFCDMVAPSARILPGACDPLTTPRPLGPLLDIALQLHSPRLSDMLQHAENRPRIFDAVLTELSNKTQPAVVVFEDVHWADEATLDLLRYLGRRMAQTRALLIATYRADEVGDRHPLRLVLGDLATTAAVRRMVLEPLSAAAVRALAGNSGIDPTELHRQTGGNPFFVTAILAARGERMPATVRDAVLARAARLTQPARDVLDAAAVIGYRVEPWLLDAVAQPGPGSVESCLDSGMLHVHGNYIVFPHELSREAVLTAITPQRGILLNRRALDALRAAPTAAIEVARLAHHAEAAADAAAVLEFAPEAARRAEALGAHRQAAAQYARALRFAHALPAAERAALLVKYSFECATVDNYDDAIAADHEIIRIWRDEGNALMEGWGYTYLAACLITVGRMREAQDMSDRSIAMLEALPESKELAEAYAYRANLFLQKRECVRAIETAQKALDLAQAGGYDRIVVNALNRLGAARLAQEDESGLAILDDAMQRAAALNAHLFNANAYSNLGGIPAEQHDFLRADEVLTRGITFAIEHEADTPGNLMRAYHAVTALHLGRWSEAEEEAEYVLRRTGATMNARIVANTALARLQLRRGDSAAAHTLDEALAMALPTELVQRIAPVRAARAEAAWLNSDSDAIRLEASAALEQALQLRQRWFAGELLYWLSRADNDIDVPDWIARPFALQIAGEWQQAAQEWASRGCPYEAASALAETRSEDTLRVALQQFEKLGATPMMQRVTKKLREAGVRSIPRGPRPSTRSNPALLTRRELEVLELMSEGLQNTQIAERLFLSAKTVGHHVSAVLAKLGVATRAAAAHAAAQRGLLPPK